MSCQDVITERTICGMDTTTSVGSSRNGSGRATITVSEAADILGIGRSAAYEAVARGEIPAIRVGRRLLVPLARLYALLGISPVA